MRWILACDHRLGDTCQLLPPRGPLPGGLDVAPAPAPSWALAIQTGGQWAAQPMCRGLFSLPTSTVWTVRRGPGQLPDDSETPLSVPLESDIPITASPANSYSLLELGSVTHPRLLLHHAHKSNSYLQLQQD